MGQFQDILDPFPESTNITVIFRQLCDIYVLYHPVLQDTVNALKPKIDQNHWSNLEIFGKPEHVTRACCQTRFIIYINTNVS